MHRILKGAPINGSEPFNSRLTPYQKRAKDSGFLIGIHPLNQQLCTYTVNQLSVIQCTTMPASKKWLDLRHMLEHQHLQRESN